MPPRRDEDLTGLRNDVEILKKAVYIGNGRPSLFESVSECKLKIEEVEKDIKEIKENQTKLEKQLEKNHREIIKKMANQDVKLDSKQTDMTKIIVVSAFVLVGLILVATLDLDLLKNFIKMILALLL